MYPLESLTVKQLKDVCKNNKLRGYSKLNKNPLIDFIRLNLDPIVVNNDPLVRRPLFWNKSVKNTEKSLDESLTKNIEPPVFSNTSPTLEIFHLSKSRGTSDDEVWTCPAGEKYVSNQPKSSEDKDGYILMKSIFGQVIDFYTRTYDQENKIESIWITTTKMSVLEITIDYDFHYIYYMSSSESFLGEKIKNFETEHVSIDDLYLNKLIFYLKNGGKRTIEFVSSNTNGKISFSFH